MSKTSRDKPNNSSRQKLIFLCAIILVCALVYLFSRVKDKDDQGYIAILTPAFSPVNTAGAFKGVRGDVFMERLIKAGFFVSEKSYDFKPVTLGIGKSLKDVNIYTGELELLFKENYVCGFILELPYIGAPAVGYAVSEDAARGGEMGELEKYQKQLEIRRQIIRLLLFETIDILNAKDSPPAPVLLYWEETAIEQLKNGDKALETSGDYTFAAIRSQDGKITVSLSL